MTAEAARLAVNQLSTIGGGGGAMPATTIGGGGAIEEFTVRTWSTPE